MIYHGKLTRFMNDISKWDFKLTNYDKLDFFANDISKWYL